MKLSNIVGYFEATAVSGDLGSPLCYKMELFNYIRESKVTKVKEYLSLYAKPITVTDEHGYSPLHLAAMYEQMEIIKLLCDYSDINATNSLGYSILHTSITQNNLQVVEYLLSRGASLEINSNDGWSCLHTAAQLGLYEVVQCLVENGCDVNYRNLIGLNALHLAISRGHLQIVKYLMSNGVEIDSNSDSYTPLHVASLIGRFDCVLFILKQGVHTDRQNGQGNTALHLACFEGDVAVVKLLLDHQVDTTILNYDDESIVDVAKPPCDLVVREAYNLQLKRDASLTDMYNACSGFDSWRMPKEIKLIVLEFLSIGLNHREFIDTSTILMNPVTKQKLKHHRLAREMIKECRFIL